MRYTLTGPSGLNPGDSSRGSGVGLPVLVTLAEPFFVDLEGIEPLR